MSTLYNRLIVAILTFTYIGSMATSDWPLGADPATGQPPADTRGTDSSAGTQTSTNQPIDTSNEHAPEHPFTLAIEEPPPGAPANSATKKPIEATVQPQPPSIAKRFQQLPRFGQRIFRGGPERLAATPIKQETIQALPVPPEYVLGAGDVLAVRCWRGLRENVNETATISSEGSIYLPLLGDTRVASQTLQETRELITRQYTRLYAQAQVSVILSQPRTVEVYVIGEVQWPGKYTLPSSATVFMALYVAGGPSDIGSLRRIQILKRPTGGYQRIDLYDHLVYGRPLADANLETGDTVFVPVVGPEAAVSGQVLRPGRYELEGNEGLDDLIAMCGGLQPTADPTVVHIWRKTPGGRQLLSVDMTETQQDSGTVQLRPGDFVEVLQSPDAPVNIVEISGAVKRPGIYAHVKGDRISDLLKKAGGLSETAYTRRGKLLRRGSQLHYRITYFTVDKAAAGDSAADLLLQPHDKVIIYSQTDVEPPAQVVIRGPVPRPGCYQWTSGMKVSDLLLQAGGLLAEAYGLRARLLRLTSGNKQQLVSVALDSAAQGDLDADITLQRGDILEVLRAEEVTVPSEVRISGYINSPGTYKRYEGMRASDLILAAGGLTPGAGPALQCVSGRTEGEIRTTQLRLLQEANPAEFSVVPDLALQDDDHIAVLGSGQFIRRPPVVIVEGEVKQPGAYPLPGSEASLWAVLQNAGGLLGVANPRGIIVYRLQDKFFPSSRKYEATAQLQQVLSTFNRERREQILEKDKRAGVAQGRISRVLTNIFSSEGGATVVVPPRLLSETLWAEAIPIDGERLVASEGRQGDIALMDGDHVVVPRRSHTVGVVGAVVRSGAIPYEGPKPPSTYVELAGGAAEDANLARMVVIQANTRVVPAKMVSEVYPGDVIVVPSDFLVRTVRSGTGYERLLRALAGLATAFLIF